MEGENETEIEQPEDDARADIEAAYETAEAEMPDESGEVADGGTETAATAEDVTDKPAADGEPGSAAEGVVEPEGTQVADAASGALPAPGAWNPEAREKWNELPAEVQQEVARRERERAVEIQRDTETLNYGSAMTKALAPFQSVIAMEGVNEVAAMQNLAQTAAGLRMGTPQQKAQIVNNIIQSYGVDIETLDGLLAGEPATTPENQALMDMIDNRLAPMQDFMGTVQGARQSHVQQTDASAANDVAQFSEGKEFMGDLRMEMADLLDMASARGQTLSLDQAYERAMSFHPDIQKIVSDRNVVATAQAEQKVLEEKKRAASTISGDPNAGATAALGDDLRGTLEELYDQGVANQG